MLNLGVNIDHVATVRQARLAMEPNPVEAALLAQQGGAWGITAHLREDRRHINDADIMALKENVLRLNMEMAVTDEMVEMATTRVIPHSSCLVPEKRQELTTEGGLSVTGNFARIKKAIDALHASGITVSCFIDPDSDQVRASAEAGSDYIELHTGTYSNTSGRKQQDELVRLREAAILAAELGLKVNAGHGIDYRNIEGILTIPHLHELNIGHSIVARAVMAGMVQAVREMAEHLVNYKS